MQDVWNTGLAMEINGDDLQKFMRCKFGWDKEPYSDNTKKIIDLINSKIEKLKKSKKKKDK